MKKNLLLFALAFFSYTLNAQEFVLKKNPSQGDLKPTYAVDNASYSPISRWNYFPLLYATSPDGTVRGVFKTTVGNPENTDPALAFISVDYQSMERVGDEVYVITYYEGFNSFGKLNPETGTFTMIRENDAPDGFMAWNPVTNEMYVTKWGNENSSPFGKIDLATGDFIFVGMVPGIFTIAIDNDGICYGASLGNSGNSKFGIINLLNGQFSQISTYTGALNYIQNLSIDRSTNELYHAARFNMSSNPVPWYKINKTTGNITNLGTFPTGRVVESFVILDSNIPPEAPAAATNFTATPNASGQLNATLNWTNPTTTAGGAPLTGLTSVKIYENNGTNPLYTYLNPVLGAAENYTPTVTSPGLYEYKIIASNAVGDGLPAIANVWMGHDVPAAPTNVQLTENNFVINLSWSAPTTGLHAGYFTPTGLVYDVYRLPDNVSVASNQTGLSCSETIVQPGNYIYKIVAKNNAGEGGAAFTTSLTLCPAVSIFPYMEGFENNGTDLPACWSQEQIYWELNWTVEEASFGNPATAHGGEHKLCFPYFPTGSTTMLSTAALNISAVTNPALKFWHTQKVSGEDQDILRVYYKSSPNGTWSLLAAYTTDVPDWTERTLLLPNQSSNYYIGFEGLANWGYGIQLDDISVINFSGYVDAELSEITAPTAGTHINLTNNEHVTVIIKNNGSASISGFPVVLEHNGNSIATEIFTGNIPSLGQSTFTFAAPLDLSAAGEHEIKVTVNLPNDVVPENNSKTIMITNFSCSPVTNFPFTEGFEDTTFPPSCWQAYNLAGTFGTWEQTTTYKHSGNASAFHNIVYGGMLENWLVTPPIAIANTGNYVLEFWSYNVAPQYHYYSGVWVSTTGSNPATSTFTEIKELTGDELTASWKKISISLSNDFAGETVYIAFKYAGDLADGWSIDDVSIDNFEGFTDAELLSITTPPAGINTDLTDSEEVTVVVKNNGSNAITGFEMILKLNENDVATETFTDIIPSLEQRSFTFANTLNLSESGEYEIKVTVNLPNDEMPENNSKTITVTNVVCSPITQFPFNEGFEGTTFPPPCWTVVNIAGTQTWERNIDIEYFIHSGSASAGHSYNSGMQESWLITPAIAVAQNGELTLEFWSLNWDPSFNQHTGIWVSTTNTDPASFTLVKKLSGSEISDTWQKISIPLGNAYAGETIYFGFKYAGDFADGWYIDDVSFLFKQINVSTTIQKKSMLLEEFTGIHCPYCLQGHRIAGNLLNANENAYVIAIHSGFFAVPNSDEPDFRIPEGEIIANEFNADYPSGTINRHPFDGEIIQYAENWIADAKKIHADDAPVNILLTGTFNGNTRKLFLKAEGYYTLNVTEPSHWLNIVVIENEIAGPQIGSNSDYDYIHNNMLRGFITPMDENVWGQEIVAPEKGNTFEFEYEYTLPDNINGVIVKPENIEVIAFVCAEKTEVLNVTGIKPSYINYEKPLNATLFAPVYKIGDRYGFNFFEAQLKNRSHLTITSAKFEVTLNDKMQEVEWSGEISAFQTKPVTITIEPYIINESNSYSIKLIALNDENVEGNTISGNFNAPIETTEKILIEIQTDLHADENHFLIKDRDGNMVKEFGPYQPNLVAVHNETITLDKNETYCFEVTDKWWDGILDPRGYFKLHNEDGVLIFQTYDIQGFGDRVFIHTSKELSIIDYDNRKPEINIFYDYLRQTIEISFTPIISGVGVLSLYTLAGNLLLEKKVSLIEGENYEISLPASQYAKGIYLIKIDQGMQSTAQKLGIY